jgi:hypothetical protein
MTSRLRKLLNRAKDIYQEEGLLATIRRTVAFAVSLILSAISYENSEFYVTGRVLRVEDEAKYRPKIPNVTHRIVETIEQLGELINEGYDLSLLDISKPRYRLEKGATLSLVFVDHEIGHMNWTAFTEEAQKAINRYPYKVDFANHEVTGGASWTDPKYRRQGLSYYAAYKGEQYFIGKGVIKSRSIKLTDNAASLGQSIKRGTRILAKARYIRILGLEFWRERPANSTNDEGELITTKIETITS